MSNSYDVIVLGVGSMGSSACYHLARRGCKVLGLEQFDITHEFGSHAGQSRIIRKAYFEDSNYVPLLERAYENWKSLEEETGTQLYYRTGLAYFGSADTLLIDGVKQSASLFNIQVDQIDPVERVNRFPQFKIPRNYQTLFEPDAGFVTPEKAIRRYAEQAIKRGAEIHVHEKVSTWKKDGSGFLIISDKGSFHCDKLVITAGAWAGKVIPSLSEKLRITRQFVAWLKPGTPAAFEYGNFPCWLLADDEKPGCYYGFPILPDGEFDGPAGLKLAHHHPALQTDPDNVDRQLLKDDEEDLKFVLDKYFHDSFELLSYKICLYANSPDENFIIDHLPGFGDKVTIACGFSGHGFKFASVIGEILADLTLNGKSSLPIDFLTLERLGF